MQRVHHRLLTTLALVAVPLTGCDDGASEPTDSVELRWGTNNNCAPVKVQSGGGTYSWNGIPNDDDPVDPNGPLHERYVANIIQNSNNVFAADFERRDAAQACHTICRREKLNWEGEGCVVDGSYDFGEIVATEQPDGSRGFAVEVFADVGLGCECTR